MIQIGQKKKKTRGASRTPSERAGISSLPVQDFHFTDRMKNTSSIADNRSLRSARVRPSCGAFQIVAQNVVSFSSFQIIE